MGYLVISDGARLVQRLGPNRGDQTQQQVQLLQAFGLEPDVAAALDLERPLAVAMLNPSLLAVHDVKPYVAMIPVRSTKAVEAVLTAHHVPIEHTAWGISVPSGEARMHIGFQDGYAVVAWRPELLDAAVQQLKPLMGRKADAPIVVHVELDNVYSAYGPQLAKLFGQLAAGGGPGPDPQRAYAMRSLREAARYFGSVKDVELLADFDSGGLTFTLRADGKAGGSFGGYVQQQQPGPAWGVQFLPRDAVLAFATHGSAVGRADELDASLDYLSEAAPQRQVGDNEKEHMRRSLERASESQTGELAYAVWPGRAGGIGLGGAYRITNAVEARAAASDAYAAMAPQLGGMIMRALTFDPSLGSRAKVSKRTIKLDGGSDLEADLVEVSMHWPKEAQAERQVFESLFGKKLILATAFVGEQALFAAGADWSERLNAMVGTARGAPQASLGDEPAFVEALRYRPGARVSLVYVESAGMARFVASLVRQSHTLDEEQQEMVTRLLAQVGHGAIVATSNANGLRYEVTTHVPQSAIVGVPRLNGALWRMALSPMLNPPMMPPMPLPPPHLTPGINRAETGTGRTM